MFKTSYEQFIDDYAVEMKEAMDEFHSLDKKAILENEEDLNKALGYIDSVYDVGVCDYLERCLCRTEEMTILSMANRALNNSNRYGTEMRQIINAVTDFTHRLRRYLPEEEEE